MLQHSLFKCLIAKMNCLQNPQSILTEVCMNRYFIRRLLATIPLMFVISIFVFMFIHLIPGDPAKTLAGVEASVEEVEAIREEFGLNKPILVQYVDYMKNLFHGDMGRSLKSNLPVTEMIASRMPSSA